MTIVVENKNSTFTLQLLTVLSIVSITRLAINGNKYIHFYDNNNNNNNNNRIMIKIIINK